MSWFKWEPLTREEEEQIIFAISEAELNTSGEIRVHIDKWCKTDPVFKASNVFEEIGMDQTDQRNGVLIYIAKKEKKFAILGDTGINEVVPQDFWESTKEIMRTHFKNGNTVKGICAGIEEAGKQLKQYFPYQDDDIDELPNEISYG